MQRSPDGLIFSASDLVNFLECEHIATLDLLDLESPLPKTEEQDEARLLQAMGIAHERRLRDALRTKYGGFVDIASRSGGVDDKVIATTEAMRNGVDVIYQATLRDGNLVGQVDFLRKTNEHTSLGRWGYEALDTKLSRSTKAKFIIQLSFYSALVGKTQGVDPRLMYVVLGDMSEESYRCAEYAHYFRSLCHRFRDRVLRGAKSTSYPTPCPRCAMCKWSELCEQRRRNDDHLCQVANISRQQIAKLQALGIGTLKELANLPDYAAVPRIQSETLTRLRQQASLQLNARMDGEKHFVLLPTEQGKGLTRLPRPDRGDMFFDMEGDPYEEGGLEYLFGVLLIDDEALRYRAFWAHNRSEEKLAFERFMDLVAEQLRRHPNAYVYHYAHYEPTALKRLMSLHGTREAEVDSLLRAGKLVDLYQVVQEGVRVSEPRYSLKNIEHFYAAARKGDVTTAGASIVFYEHWKASNDPKVLEDIEAYNRNDVQSTKQCRDWLVSLRPAGMSWVTDHGIVREGEHAAFGQPSKAEERLRSYGQALVEPLPEDRLEWPDEDRLRELIYQLLDFHRRAEKPEWWAMFARQEMSNEELIQDGECLGGLTYVADESICTSGGKRRRYSYRVPEQETKLKTGDACVRVDTLDELEDLVVDEDSGIVSFVVAQREGAEPLPPRISIGPGRPIPTYSIRNALFQFADAYISGSQAFRAGLDILRRAAPRIRGRSCGETIIDDEEAALPQIIEAVAGLDRSYLFVQGPPGAGKTYTGSHIIVELLARGATVAVSSNSHKAINNLLGAVEQHARMRNLKFEGAKKSSSEEHKFRGHFIQDVSDNRRIITGSFQLVAGTAWLFTAKGMGQRFDYIFIDEAGQVSLANVIAVSTSARNVVLLGDQMQLGQPIQGVHPGDSGLSVLDYLLQGRATIPAERGAFLGITWRMHPDVCRFISDAVYDGRLASHPTTITQRLLLSADAPYGLPPTGIRYIPVDHEGNSQRSEEEAFVVRDLYMHLLTQSHSDRNGAPNPITIANVLVVAPYNMQVNLLKRLLPQGARVGTVDKFQGQEAEVVIISMATSNAETLPRNIEFLYTRNRLNVAISRARCLAVLVCSPALMTISCQRPEQIAMVNTLCWVKEYSEGAN